MPAPPQTFLEESAAIGVAFDDGDLDKLGRYLELLQEANTRFNLTSITDLDEAWRRHILDSMTLLPMLASMDAGETVVDVGSGGGAPGLPLAIALPELKFTLIESTGKKAGYLNETAQSLGLANVTVVNARAEDVGRDEAHRDHYAAATARALGPLRVSLELVMPLVRPGGLGLFIKGAKAAAELQEAKRALKLLGGAVIENSQTPTGRIVVVEKLHPTGSKYPRRPGEPKRDPL